MGVIALVGSVTLLLKPATSQRLLLPLVALAAGSLIGGAMFHMIPASLALRSSRPRAWRQTTVANGPRL
jgi:zinc and cadmium transporter